jgi:hypothetical protein
MKIVAWCFLVVAACNADALDMNDKSPTPVAKTDRCSAHGDAGSCQSDEQCYWDGCPTCTGWSPDSGCVDKSGPQHGRLCPTPSCTLDCTHITQPEICAALSECAVISFCGLPTCVAAGTPAPPDGPISCPDFCQFHKDEASCNSATFIDGCHATFLDPDQFDCTLSSCKPTFATCVDGPPRCSTPAQTGWCPPSPTCPDNFVPDYDDFGCVRDCVRTSQCGA